MTTGLNELPRERTQLLDNLGWIRRNLGPVTPELSDALADHMNIRRGEVAEVASFYSYLRLPADVVRVCTGPVCDCLGGRALLEQSPGAVEVPCIGHCDLAPAMMRGDEVVPGVTHAANHGRSIDLLAPDEPRDPPALDPDRIVAELEASGLVGYGGAGFPTFRKWAAVRDYPGPRVVIVNADEGEPGTIKDRYVMELRPHLLVEGIEIAMRFAEADEGYVYLREEYTTARERLSAALAARGLPVTIVTGAGSYVCGEETAMLESMEGRRGMPRLRPPFPVEAGFLGRPTLINNVETLAHIPAVLRLGGASLAARPSLVGLGRGREAGLLRGAGRRHRPAADRRLRGRRDRGHRRRRTGRRRVRDCPARCARRAAHARGPGAVGLRPRLGRPPGLPRVLLRAAAPARDHAVLRRGVVPEMYAVPHRHARARARPPRAGGRQTGDARLAARGVARRDGEGLDLWARPGRAHPPARRDAPLAGALHAARQLSKRRSDTVVSIVTFPGWDFGLGQPDRFAYQEAPCVVV